MSYYFENQYLSLTRWVKLVFDENFRSVRVIFVRKSSFGFAQDDRTSEMVLKTINSVEPKGFSIHFLFHFIAQKILELTFLIITPNVLSLFILQKERLYVSPFFCACKMSLLCTCFIHGLVY